MHTLQTGIVRTLSIPLTLKVKESEMADSDRMINSGRFQTERLSQQSYQTRIKRQMSLVEREDKLAPLSHHKSSAALHKSRNSVTDCDASRRHSVIDSNNSYEMKGLEQESPMQSYNAFCGVMQPLKVSHTSILGRRPSQEDAYVQFIYGQYSIIALFDGHNGSLTSKFCANSLEQVLVENIKLQEANSKLGIIDFEFALQETINRLNTLVCGSPQLKIQGTTAVIVLLDHDLQEIHISNVGDSRCLVGFKSEQDLEEYVSFNNVVYHFEDLTCGTTNTSTKVASTKTKFFTTIDHKPTSAEEAARLLKAGATVQEYDGVTRINACLSVSRSIGDSEFKRVVTCQQDYYRISCITQLQYIFLACDGFFDVFDNVETDSMITQCLTRKFDNILLRDNLLNRQFTKNVQVSYEDSKMSTVTLFENVNSQRSYTKQVTQALTKLAYLKNSDDNVSVVCCFID